MPPGVHTITGTKGGEPFEVTLKVTAAAAIALQQQLQEVRSRAAAGHEDLPYLDFNHDDREASARVTEFFWGGDDPVQGGIRAKVEWTGVGRRALEDKAYRRFSPSFFANAAGEITGAPLNMGGLVNSAAFKTITPIVAGAAGVANPERKSLMDNEKLAADLAAAQRTIADLTARLDKAGHQSAIQAKDTEITSLKGQITALQTQVANQQKVNAKAIVKAAIDSGRLAPQATEIHTKWEEQIARDPAAADLLNQIEPVFAKLGTVVTNANGGVNAGAGTGATANTGEHPFVVKAKQHAKDNNCHFTDATVAVAAKEPKLYSEYCASLTVASK